MGVFLKGRQKLVTLNKFREKLLFLIYAIFPIPGLILQPHVSWKCPSLSLLSYRKGSEGSPGWRWVTALEGSSSSTLSCFVSFVGNTHLLYTLPSSGLCILPFRNFFILELWSCSLLDFIQSSDLPDMQRRVVYSEFSVWSHFPQSPNGHSAPAVSKGGWRNWFSSEVLAASWGITMGHPALLPPVSGMPGEWLSSCSERTQHPSATSQRREEVYFSGGSKDSFWKHQIVPQSLLILLGT